MIPHRFRLPTFLFLAWSFFNRRTVTVANDIINSLDMLSVFSQSEKTLNTYKVLYDRTRVNSNVFDLMLFRCISHSFLFVKRPLLFGMSFTIEISEASSEDMFNFNNNNIITIINIYIAFFFEVTQSAVSFLF